MKKKSRKGHGKLIIICTCGGDLTPFQDCIRCDGCGNLSHPILNQIFQNGVENGMKEKEEAIKQVLGIRSEGV